MVWAIIASNLLPILLVAPTLRDASAFTTQPRAVAQVTKLHRKQTSSTQIAAGLKDFLPKIPIPGRGAFEDLAFEGPGPYDGSDESLIAQAKRVLQSDFGLTDPSLLDSRFIWIGPTVDDPLSTTDYIAAGRFFNLRGAFPDLDYRAHDFRIDEDGVTVRCTCRVTGSMRGELRLRSGVLAPTGVTMKCPPEAVSMTFDRSTGKLTKLCTGFVMDRLVGNTQGTSGVQAASVIAGEKVSGWDIYPPATVLSRVFARPAKPVPETTTYLAPFPETVMIQLAKGVISAEMASEDQTLLSDDFTFCTPIIGPVRKAKFLSNYAEEELAGYEPNFSNFRIDPYDPVRIWVDVKPTAPGFVGPPQAMSFTFDDDGFCTRITSRAVMDPSIGNAGGLGGPDGLKYAKGQASPAITTRPLPRVLGRLKKLLLSPVTGVGVDEYKSTSSPAALTPLTPTTPRTPPVAPSIPPKTPASRLVESTSPKPPKAPPKLTTPEPTIKPLKVTKVTMPKSTATAPKPKEAPKTTTQPAAANPLEGLKDFTISISENIRPPPIAKKAPSTPPKPAAKKTLPKVTPRKTKEAPKATEPFVSNPLDSLNELIVSVSENIRPPPVARKAPSIQVTPSAPKKPSVNIAKQQAAAKAAAERTKKAQQEAAAAQRAVAERKKQEAAKDRQAAAAAKKAAAEKRKQEAVARKREAAEASEQRKQKAEARKREAAAVAEKRKQETEARKREAAAKAEAKKAEIAAKQQAEKVRREAAAKAKLAEIEAKKAAKTKAPPVSQKAPTEPIVNPEALNGLAQAVSSATIGILGLGKQELEELPKESNAPVKKAPPGVPTLKRWRQNADKSITGLVSGSRGFDDGQRITTSPIATGTVAPGQIVKTGSGSRYFLA